MTVKDGRPERRWGEIVTVQGTFLRANSVSIMNLNGECDYFFEFSEQRFLRESFAP